ncbi:MAG: hypothetical protein U1A25_00765 [Candidatus Sungbacteria bacterium]|nr:hypothetical protein [bacterium]MDZ4260173.1 hypothetical protein [Candidatus Sungbacteria bacterium]
MRYIVRGIDAFAYVDSLKRATQFMDDSESKEEVWIDTDGSIEVHASLRTVLVQEDAPPSLERVLVGHLGRPPTVQIKALERERILIGYPGERCITIEGGPHFVRSVLKILEIPTSNFTRQFCPEKPSWAKGIKLI